MKNKLIAGLMEKKEQLRTNILAAGAAASVTASTLMTTVYADGDQAKTLMETAIKIIAVLVFIPAGILTITGIIAYAAAHSEGDGPAQTKAINKLSAGIMLAALGIILTATAGTFSGIISTSIGG